MIINIKIQPEMMMGRLFNISENIPILKMNRERGYWNHTSETLTFHLGNNYIYVGPSITRLNLPASPLANDGKSPEQYRRWLFSRICASDSTILSELSKVTLHTSIAHWPEDESLAAIVQKAANWLWTQKPTPNVPSDLDYSGRFGESDFGWDGYAKKHEVLYNPYRTSSLFDKYDEAWEYFVNLPSAIHIDVCRLLAYKKAKAMTVNDWNSERKQSFPRRAKASWTLPMDVSAAVSGRYWFCSPIMDGASAQIMPRNSSKAYFEISQEEGTLSNHRRRGFDNSYY